MFTLYLFCKPRLVDIHAKGSGFVSKSRFKDCYFWKTVYSGVDDQQNSNFKWVDANSRCNYFVAASYRHLCSLPLQNYFAEKNIAVSEFELRTSEAPDMDANPHTRMLPHLSINLNKFIPTYLSVKATCQTPIQLAYPKSCTLDLCQRVPQVCTQ